MRISQSVVGRWIVALFAIVTLQTGSALAQPVRADLGWQTYVDQRGGTSVQFPSNLFRVPAGETEQGIGKIFRTEDGRAEFSAYSLDNETRETPRSYLQKKLRVDVSKIDYRRVTDRFFVVSGVRDGQVYYSRCNFHGRMHCVYMSYPASETRAWDGIVTRVSHSLRGRRG